MPPPPLSRRIRRPSGESSAGTHNRTAELAQTSIAQRAELEKAGLYLPPRPAEKMPRLPDDPSALDGSQLIEEMVRFTRWTDYSGAQLALAEIEERYAEEASRKSEAILLLQHMPSSEAMRKREDTMTRVRAEVRQHPQMEAAAARFRTAYATRKLVASIYESLERDAALLSREITRRSDSRPAHQRERKWSA